MHHDPEQYREKLEGLIARYRAGEFSTVVLATSLKAMRIQADEIAELIAQHIFVHQASLPYKRGDIRS